MPGREERPQQFIERGTSETFEVVFARLPRFSDIRSVSAKDLTVDGEQLVKACEGFAVEPLFSRERYDRDASSQLYVQFPRGCTFDGVGLPGSFNTEEGSIQLHVDRLCGQCRPRPQSDYSSAVPASSPFGAVF